MKKYVALFLTCLFLLNTCVIIGFAEEDEEEIYATGALPMTEEEVAEFKNTVPEIIDVKPNQLYIDRINEEFDEDSLALMGFPSNVAADGEEIVTSMDAELELLENNEIAIPSAVDNSKELTFPFIEDQGDLNSCLGWSFGYYQLTNNANKIRGTVARNGEANTAANRCPGNIYSPNWIYNLGNNGEDKGMYGVDAMNILYTYGCPSVEQVPISDENGDYLNWYASASIWESALHNKCDLYYGDLNSDKLVTPITSPDSPYLKDLKKLLANGYVVSVLTTVDARGKTVPKVKTGRTSGGYNTYVWTEIRDFPEGGHAVTIVGYDDNYKVDINGDGIYQTGEYGAFKIANSWGAGAYKHNSGCVWLSYDALNAESSVLDSVHSKRIPALQEDLYYFVKPQKEYKPLLTAKVELKTQDRSKIRGYIGIVDAENPQISHEVKITNTDLTEDDVSEPGNIAFNRNGGEFNLNGTTGEGTGEVVFDLTQLLREFTLEKNHTYNIYLKIYDKNKTTIINSLALKDHNTENTYYSSDTPVSSSESNYFRAYVGYTSSISSVMQDKIFSLDFNNKINSITIDGGITVLKNGENVNVNTTLSPTKKRILLAPQDGVFHNGFYSINIHPSLMSEGGNLFATTVSYPFYIPFH